MNVALRYALLTVAAGLWLVPSGYAEAPSLPTVAYRSVSASKQFYIYCEDSTIRIGTSTIAEDTRKSLDKLLRHDDHWVHTIVIRLVDGADVPTTSPTHELRLFNTVEGLRFQLDIVIGRPDSDLSMRREVLRALLMERAYRHITDAPDQLRVVTPPEWLVRGIHGLLDRERIQAQVEVFKALLGAESVPDLGSYMATDVASLEAAPQAIYEAYAVSMVKSLFELPEGRGGVLSYLTSAPLTVEFNTPESLQRHFLSLGGDQARFAKGWALNLARLAVTDNIDPVSTEQAGRQLAEIVSKPIAVEVDGKQKVFTFEQIAQIPKSRERDVKLQKILRELNDLSVRSNPLFQPVQLEYGRLVGTVLTGKKRKIKKIPQQLVVLDATRAALDELAVEITDYMNWIEGTQIGQVSHQFDGYFREAKRLAAQPRRLHRDDAVTRYMDSLEKEVE